MEEDEDGVEEMKTKKKKTGGRQEGTPNHPVVLQESLADRSSEYDKFLTQTKKKSE